MPVHSYSSLPTRLRGRAQTKQLLPEYRSVASTSQIPYWQLLRLGLSMYNHALLFDAVRQSLWRSPSRSLRDLALELGVSRRTIENSVLVASNKTFREIRKEILVALTGSLLASNPTMPVKELCFTLGFKSPSAFSRAIKRICGVCPGEYRSRLVRDSNYLGSPSS